MLISVCVEVDLIAIGRAVGGDGGPGVIGTAGGRKSCCGVRDVETAPPPAAALAAALLSA